MIEKFTPGPWSRDRMVFGDAIKDERGRQVAKTLSRQESGAAEANAALIAAAPELYAALSHALRHLPMPTGALSGSEGAAELLRVRIAAGDALAKARGEK